MSTTSLAQAVGFILHGPAEDANTTVRVFDYSHKDVFRDLWLNGLESTNPKVNGQTYDWNQPAQQILIIGNDPPSDAFADLPESLRGINFRSHFTATSWLAAWKVKFSPSDKQKKEGAVEACAKIAVIDPRDLILAQGAARTLQIILGARDATGHSLVPGAAVLNAPSLANICEWLQDSKADEWTLAEDAPYLRDILKSTVWNELTSRSEQHHALSNVLGPMILSRAPAGDWNTVPTDRPKILLRKLLKACGVVSWDDRKATDLTDEDPHHSNELGKDLSILLVDDQADLGWEEWGKEVLRDAKGAINSLPDPTELVSNALTALAPKGDGTFEKRDARFSLELPRLGKDAKNPVLLLDLRLFAGKPEAERNFYKDTLLPLVNHFTDKENLAWPSFRSTEKKFQNARTAVQNGRLEIDSDDHHEVLTWLPRVIALADMSLPIILFSSTGRRDLVEPFKAYGNIITTFEKPRLTDLMGQDEAVSTRETTARLLRETVAKARLWLKVREKCLGLRTLSEGLPSQKQARQQLHVELYIDEDKRADEQGFAVGGVFAVFDSPEQADEFEDCCVRNGLRYFEDTFFTPNVSDNAVLRKHHDNGTAQLSAALNEFQTLGKQVDLGFVRLHRGAVIKQQHPLTEDEEDLRFWRMLEAVIELFCSESLPAIQRQFKAESISFSVFVGTRIVEFRQDGDFSYRGNIPVRDLRDGSRKLRSMGERDAFPLVLKGLSLHGRLQVFKLVRAAALALPYKKDPTRNLQHKTDLDRVTDRRAVAVWEFSHEWDSQMPAHRVGSTVFGKTMRPKYDFLFVQVRGLVDNVHCHANDFPEFYDPNRSAFVSLTLNQDQKGFFGTNVTTVNQQDYLRWIRINGCASAEFLSGKNANNLRPDYRALHYVADQVLRVAGQQQNFGPFDQLLTNDLAGQFTENYTEDLEQSLVASRALDGNGYLATSLRCFPVEDALTNGSLAPHARAWIAHRIWERLADSQGEVLILPQVLPLLRNQGAQVGVAAATARQSAGPVNSPAPTSTPPAVAAPPPCPTACPPPVPAPTPSEVVGVATNEAWLGPVPTGMDSRSLAEAFAAQFPDWIQEGTWAGGNDEGWWMPIKCKGVAAANLPPAISLLGSSFQITSANPDGAI